MGDGGHRGGERGSQIWERRARNMEGDERKQRKTEERVDNCEKAREEKSEVHSEDG